MTDNLAKTSTPRLCRVFSRTRLNDRINILRSDHPVLWVNAPAGSGKTSLVANYIQTEKPKSLWFQLDTGDAEIASFFYYLATAFRSAYPRKVKLPLLTPEYHGDISAFTRQFFRKLFSQLKSGTTLVFDDFHCIDQSNELLGLFNIAFNELPDSLTIIIISRNQPPAFFSRYSLNNKLIKIGWDEIRLTREEAIGVAKESSQHQPNSYEDHEIEQIRQMSDGWITGLILHLHTPATHREDPDNIKALFPLQDTDHSYHENLFDYFACEIFDQLDNATQSFLTNVVYFPKFTVRLANTLLNSTNAKTIINSLERRNYFISKKGGINPFYEFHPLFRQFLFNKSNEIHHEEAIAYLTRKVSEILIDNNHIELAAPLLIKVEDWTRLSDILKIHARSLEQHGRHSLLNKWLNYLPGEFLSGDAELIYWQGIAIQHDDPFSAIDYFIIAFTSFKRSKNSKWLYASWYGIAECIILKADDYIDTPHWIDELHGIETYVTKSPDLETKAKITAITFNLMILACPDHPDFNRYLTNVERMFRLVPVADVRCLTGGVLSLYCVLYGLTQKLEIISKQLKKYVSNENVKPIPRISGYWSIISSGWNSGSFSIADENISAALDTGKKYGVHITDKWILSAAALNNLLDPASDKAGLYIENYFSRLNHKQRFYVSQYYYLKAWHSLENQNDTEAQVYINTAVDIIDELGFPIMGAAMQLSKAATLIYRDLHPDAGKIIEHVLVTSSSLNNEYLSLVQCNLLKAWSFLKQSKRLQAVDSLKTAFSKANELNNVGGGWWLHSMLTDLCCLALEENIEPRYTRRLISIYRIVPTEQLTVRHIWPFPVRIQTLGCWSITINGEPVQGGRKSPKKQLELLQAIIAFGGKSISGELLAHNLWGDLEGDAAYNTFTTTLHRLRKLLVDNAIIYRNGQVSVNRSICWVDILEVNQQTEMLGRYSAGNEIREILGKIDFIFKLYKGSFMQREPDLHWILSAREHFQDTFSRSIKVALRLLEHKGEYEAAISVYQRALDMDIVNESLYQGVMRCSINLGRNADGMAAYQRCRKLLSKNLSVVPSTETENLRSRLQQVM